MSWLPVGAQDITSSLNQIPFEDQVLLENLFSFFVQWDQLSHVLFFETKPVCFSGITLECDFCTIPPCISKDPLNFQKKLSHGWTVWKNYEHLFPHPNFVICEETHQIRKGDEYGTVVDIFFINKKSFLSYLSEHQSEFKEELGANFSPKKLLLEIEERKILRPLINHDEMLLGLLLSAPHCQDRFFPLF